MDANANQPWSVLRLLNWTKDYLAKAGTLEPRISAEVLLACALGCERIELYARYNYQPTDEELAAFREHVRRAARHEPVAYLTGVREFYSLKFRVTPDVLIPRPETEALVSETLDYLAELGRGGTVWDVGTGSGCVGVAIATQSPETRVLATDVSSEAVAVAQENAERHGVADRVLCAEADLLELPDEASDLPPFNVIVSNPPYVADSDEVAATVKHEPSVALYGGAEGLDNIRRLIAGAPDLLRPGGPLILEFAYNQSDAIRDLIHETRRYQEPVFHRDAQGIERTVVARTRPAGQ